MMKTLRVTLADLEGIPHATAAAATAVTVTAAYTGPVILTDGTIIPTAIKAKTVGSSGVVNFSVHASDDPAVRPDHQGFAITVTAQIRLANGTVTAFKRTVKPLESMGSTIQLGTLTEAEGLPPQWVTIDELTDEMDAAVAAAEQAATDASNAASAAASSASDADNAVTLAQQAQAAAYNVPDVAIRDIINNTATETHAALGTYWTPAKRNELGMPRYVHGGGSMVGDGDGAPNYILSSPGGSIADDLSGCVILGGFGGPGISGPGSGFDNVIGDGIIENIWTGTPNAPADKTLLRGTTANVSIVGGYDNVAAGLATIMFAFHSYTTKSADHSTISGGASHAIKSGGGNTIGGGSAHTIDGGGYNTVVGGYGNSVQGQNNVAGGFENIVGPVNASTTFGRLNTVNGSRAFVAGLSNTVTGLGGVALGSSNTTSADHGVALGSSNAVTAGLGGVALGFSNTTSAYAVAIGDQNVASGSYSAAIGRSNEAREASSLATGAYSVAHTRGQHAHAAAMFAVNGDAQTSVLPLLQRTTSGAQQVLTVDGTTNTYYHIPLNGSVTFSGIVVARDEATGDTKSWRIEGGAKNMAGAASLVGTPTVTVLAEDTGASAWVSTAATGSFGNLFFRAIGEAGKNIRWVGRLELAEVVGP